jgi:hypothetical protein
MGVYPNFVFKVTSASVQHLLDQNKQALALDHAPKLASIAKVSP